MGFGIGFRVKRLLLAGSTAALALVPGWTWAQPVDLPARAKIAPDLLGR